MASAPSFQSVKVRKIPTSDPNIPEEEILSGEHRVAIRICKVCKQPLAEAQTIIICANCGHYAHAEHSHMLSLAPNCNLCIVENLRVSKSAFKVLFGFMMESKRSKIRKASKLSKEQLKEILEKLTEANLIERKKFLIFTSLKLSYLAHEVFQILEEIYGNEPDVRAFKSGLLVQ